MRVCFLTLHNLGRECGRRLVLTIQQNLDTQEEHCSCRGQETKDAALLKQQIVAVGMKLGIL